jgi:hypothetical protein
MKLKSLCLLLLLTSCAHPLSVRFSESTITCPSGSAYSTKDKLCHYPKVRVKKFVNKPLKIDCKQVLKQVNQCTR